MTSNDRLRIGIIGIGWYAALRHVPSFRDTGRAEIVAISRRNPDRLALAKQELNVAAAYTDWQQMLEQATLDAVVICTPNNLHAEPAIAALERGLHVLVEKPMALTSQSAQAMNPGCPASRARIDGWLQCAGDGELAGRQASAS